MRAKFSALEQTCSVRLRAKFRLDQLFCRPLAEKTLNFFHFVDFSSFSDVDTRRQSEKVEQACTTTNLLLSNGIKIVSVVLHGEIGRTNSDVEKCDEQTDRKTKNSTF